MLWEASDRMCGKRLKAHFPIFLPVLERLGYLHLDPAIRAKLLTISAATIDRLLHPLRTTSPNPYVRPRIIVRRSFSKERLGPGADTVPGYAQLHLGSYGRRSGAGHDVQILSLTDWFSGWTECAPMEVDEPSEALACFDGLRERLPFELRGVSLSGKAGFLEEALAGRGNDRSIEVYHTRSSGRAVRARIAKRREPERGLVGPRKLEAPATLETITRLCAASTRYANFFQASFGLQRRGSGSRNARDTPPQPPATRLLRSGALGESEKIRLQEIAEKLDPVQLLDEMRALQSDFARVPAELESSRDTRLQGRAGALHERPRRVLRKAGEQASKGAKRKRHWRTHKNAFEEPWPIVKTWLEVTTHQTSTELFERLRREYPGVFREGQLRSFQRRLKQWRAGMEVNLMPSGDRMADSQEWPATDRTHQLDEFR